MDEDGIGLVLVRASELRTKITTCIDRASKTVDTQHNSKPQEPEKEDEDDGSRFQDVDKMGEAEEETERLVNIRDALASLEAQLSSLQALQQQQWYEKEGALAEIDYSRKKLLKKLKEYKGEELEVIHEATAFASETVDDNSDLLLPPYPNRTSRSMVSGNGYLSHFPSGRKLDQNGVVTGNTTTEPTEGNQKQTKSQNPHKGLRLFINAAAKTVLTLVGVISILGLAGFEPRLLKRDTKFKILGLFQRGAEMEREPVRCPPGKVLVVEGGEARCLVKERVEIPFGSVAATPDVTYGCG